MCGDRADAAGGGVRKGDITLEPVVFRDRDIDREPAVTAGLSGAVLGPPKGQFSAGDPKRALCKRWKRKTRCLIEYPSTRIPEYPFISFRIFGYSDIRTSGNLGARMFGYPDFR